MTWLGKLLGTYRTGGVVAPKDVRLRENEIAAVLRPGEWWGKGECDCGAEPYKDASPCRDNHLSDCPAYSPPAILSESCPDCARRIMKRPEAGYGYIAKCGRRLLDLAECRADSPCPELTR